MTFLWLSLIVAISLNNLGFIPNNRNSDQSRRKIRDPNMTPKFENETK